MGADYRMYNPERMRILVTCYNCGKSIDIENPSIGHEACIEASGDWNGDSLLKFDINWEDKTEIPVRKVKKDSKPDDIKVAEKTYVLRKSDIF